MVDSIPSRRTRHGFYRHAHVPWLLALVAGVVVVFCSSRAAAYERVWHLGGGFGGAAAPSYQFGPAAALYGAYGLSDAFDVRVELTTSIQGRLTATNRDYGVKSAFLSLKAALAYKLDVGRWIPWIGPSAGGLASGEHKWPFDALQPTIGGIAGLDYVWTRSFAMGLCASGDYGFDQAALYGAGYVRAEYHWDW